MASIPIDPKAGFREMVNAWKAAHDKLQDPKNPSSKNVLTFMQGYWHAGNTLDSYVTYLVQTQQKDDEGIVAKSLDIFSTAKPEPPAQIWWRDDYGWWGIAFLHAADHFSSLGLSPEKKKSCTDSAEKGWGIMKDDWEANKHNGVRNNPDTKQGPETNTITNVLFLLLSLRLHQTSKYKDALETARAVFDWFYPDEQKGPKRLFNTEDLIRYLPYDPSTQPNPNERAWSADQGWFWRACLTLYSIDKDNPDKEIQERLKRVESVTERIGSGVFKNFFVDGAVSKELKDTNNYDLDFATGLGVFMRQFAFINADRHGGWGDIITKSAQNASDNSGWQSTTPSGCWHPDECEYKPRYDGAPNPWNVPELWALTLKTSAQDAFTATLGPGI